MRVGTEEMIWLKAIAMQLPMVMHQTHEKHIMTGQAVLDETEYTEIEGKPIKPDQKYVIPMPVSVAANHFRRLKRAWKRNGEAGVRAYIQTVKQLETQPQ